MAKLIMWNLMTLDGYFEGPDSDLGFHMDVWGDELEQLSLEQGNAAGALMFGRKTYDMMKGYWPTATETPEIAAFMNTIKKYVFSRKGAPADWANTEVFDGNVPSTVERLKRETLKDIYLFGSADLASSLIAYNLIDEFRICTAPRLLGQGTPLFKPGSSTKLKLLEVRPLATGGTVTRYALA